MRNDLLARVLPHARDVPGPLDTTGHTALARFHVALSSWFSFQEHFQPPANQNARERVEILYHSLILSLLAPLASSLYRSGAFDIVLTDPVPAWEDAPSVGRGTADMGLVGRRAGLELKTSSSRSANLLDTLREAGRRHEQVVLAAATSGHRNGGLIPDCPLLSVGDTQRLCQVSSFA